MEWMKALKAKVGIAPARAMTPADVKAQEDLAALDKKDAAAKLRAAEDEAYAKRQKKQGITWSATGGGNTGRALRNLGD